MSHPSLSSSTSIVDFLKSVGQGSSFSNRKQIFQAQGLDKRLGSFIGSASQNTALLKNVQGLHSSGQADFLKTPAPAPVAAPAPVPTPSPQGATPFGVPAQQAAQQGFRPPSQPQFQAPAQQAQQVAQQTAQTAQPAQRAPDQTRGDRKLGPTEFRNLTKEWRELGLTDTEIEQNFISRSGSDIFLRGDAPSSRKILAQRGALGGASAVNLTPQPQAGEDFGAQDTLDTLGGDFFNFPSADEIKQGILGSQEFSFLQERQDLFETGATGQAEATRQQLAKQFEKEKDTLEQNLSVKGLTFSGIRTKQVKALADNLASSVLGVDRKLATALLEADISAREDVFRMVEDAISAAQQGQKEAIAQLNKAGLAVVGNQLVPTVQAGTEARQRDRLELDKARFELNVAQEEFNQAESIEKLNQAQQKIDQNLRKIELSEKKEGRLGGVPGLGTPENKSEIDALARAYIQGDSLGNIGKLKGTVLQRAEELQQQDLIAQLNDPSFLVTQIDEADAAGQGLAQMREDLLELGVAPENFRDALKLRGEAQAQEIQTDGFFKKLFLGPDASISRPGFGIFGSR